MTTRFLLCDRWGKFLEELVVYAATHNQEINGEDSLSIEINQPLSKGDRILWLDGDRWCEHVFDDGTQSHEGGETYSYNLVNSLQWDLSLRQIRFTSWPGTSLDYALTQLLKLHPAWTVGKAQSVISCDVVLEKMSAYNALLELCGLYNCEIDKEIVVDKHGVVKRIVSLVPLIGQARDIRFDYGYGLYGVTKEILDEPVYTAAYGIGGAPEIEGVDDPEEIWCYVTNDAALKTWGLLNGSGGVIHAEGIYENPDVVDMATLRAETTNFLNQHSAPAISYETKIPYASLEGACLGDQIQVTDAEFTPELRLEARIGAMQRNALTREVESATFGTVTSLLPDALARALDRNRIQTRTASRVTGLTNSVENLQTQVDNFNASTNERIDKLNDENKSLRDTIEELAKKIEEMKNNNNEGGGA